MKELVWDDQWMGYDDEKTHEMKRKFANDLCFGGTMAWSVDLNSGTGDTDDAPLSTDGRCGPDNGGAMCDGSGFGKCCSSGGWCGGSDTHCGSECLNGKCHEGIETTDGTCGTGHGNTYCGLWPQGSCCSSGGWCGSSDAHYGPSCQSGACLEDSGSGSGPIYIDPEIFDAPEGIATVKCFPPCEYIFPSLTLPTPTTITFPPFTTSLERGWFENTTWTGDRTTITTSVFVSVVETTVITVPPLTTSIIPFWNYNVTRDEKSGTIILTTSIRAPPIIITQKSSGPLPSKTRTITPRPWPWPVSNEGPSPTTTSTPDQDDPPVIIVHESGSPSPICKALCGTQCRLFCDRPCLLFCTDILPGMFQIVSCSLQSGLVRRFKPPYI